ncbi:succinate dehydrogenase subunit 7A, mitochondrial-like isoform X2 [Wolffia australiana]
MVSFFALRMEIILSFLLFSGCFIFLQLTKLLEDDPALRKFKSHKKSVVRAKKIGDALIILVVAACSYEIYYKAMEKRAKFDQVSDTKNT